MSDADGSSLEKKPNFGDLPLVILALCSPSNCPFSARFRGMRWTAKQSLVWFHIEGLKKEFRLLTVSSYVFCEIRTCSQLLCSLCPKMIKLLLQRKTEKEHQSTNLGQSEVGPQLSKHVQGAVGISCQ